MTCLLCKVYFTASLWIILPLHVSSFALTCSHLLSLSLSPVIQQCASSYRPTTCCQSSERTKHRMPGELTGCCGSVLSLSLNGRTISFNGLPWHFMFWAVIFHCRGIGTLQEKRLHNFHPETVWLALLRVGLTESAPTAGARFNPN